MNRKLIAMMSALIMCSSAVPYTASAEEVTETLPEWIPQNFTEALHFDNEYGKTHIEDGVICCVRKKSIRDNYEYLTEYSGDGQPEIISDMTYNFVMPEKPDKSDTEAYQEYLDFLHENYIDESYIEMFGTVKVNFEYEVTVYTMNPASSIDIEWIEKYKDTEKFMYTETLSFETSADGEITETDLYGWFPDSPGESRGLDTVSVINGHIVFCDYLNSGYRLVFKQNGMSKLECIAGDYLDGTQLTVSPPGTRSKVIRAYKPITSGTVKVTFQEALPWQTDDAIDIIEKSYSIDDDGNITEIDGNDVTLLSMGDCNLDGLFNVSDVVMLQKWLTDGETLDCWQNADFYEDNKIDIFDLLIMKQSLTNGGIAHE
ncbi:MAG: dockerin type I repeat-containing protein [Ruminococcus sp.]|nr:dockerin type I repeat-containing protein [Ruminococcus sp.]